MLGFNGNETASHFDTPVEAGEIATSYSPLQCKMNGNRIIDVTLATLEFSLIRNLNTIHGNRIKDVTLTTLEFSLIRNLNSIPFTSTFITFTI